MGYEPTLIIKKDDLERVESVLIENTYHKDKDVQKVARYLLDINNNNVIEFDGLRLVICAPETTSFNREVRDALFDLDVEYREDY